MNYKFVLNILLFSLMCNVCVNAQADYQNIYSSIFNTNEHLFYDSIDFHTSIKPYKLSTKILEQSDSNCLYIKKLNRDNSLFITPIIQVFGSLSTEKDIAYTINTGYKVKYNWSDKISFSSLGYFGIEKFFPYYNKKIDSIGVIPERNTYLKKQSNFYLIPYNETYLSYSPNKLFTFQLGHGKNFIGDGYRSLLLSANSASYNYLKSEIHSKSIKYLFLITRGKDIFSEKTSLPDENKYSVIHYISWNLTKNINLGFFETVVFATSDSLGASRGFEWNYLNPAIFFRPVEFSLGSPDNVLMGLSSNIKLFGNTILYSQLLIDEFILSNIKARNGWWGNKFAYQLGFKINNPFRFKGLSVLVEHNTIRPYTYSHQNSIRNYGMLHQPLAHPFGANLKEYIGVLKYKRGKTKLLAKAIFLKQGIDFDNTSYGSNIYRSYEERKDDFNNFMLQGEVRQLLFGEIIANYLIIKKINLNIEARLIYRNLNQNQNIYFLFGLSTPVFQNNYDY